MNLNLQKLLYGANEPLQGTVEFDFHEWDFAGYTVTGPVHLLWEATPANGLLELKLCIDATIDTDCARCLAPVKKAWKIQNSYTVRQADLEEEFPELPILPNGMLDLEELAYGELVMDVPTNLCCEPMCVGVCPNCHLPEELCQCEKQPEGDPRLQVLRSLLEPEASE